MYLEMKFSSVIFYLIMPDSYRRNGFVLEGNNQMYFSTCLSYSTSVAAKQKETVCGLFPKVA